MISLTTVQYSFDVAFSPSKPGYLLNNTIRLSQPHDAYLVQMKIRELPEFLLSLS